MNKKNKVIIKNIGRDAYHQTPNNKLRARKEVNRSNDAWTTTPSDQEIEAHFDLFSRSEEQHEIFGKPKNSRFDVF